LIDLLFTTFKFVILGSILDT